ncbi:MAG: transposase family protein [Candidatus Competibacteraceae bacterium]|nr:transposase family protein [Candidatus Competibacteraceae bacterium]
MNGVFVHPGINVNGVRGKPTTTQRATWYDPRSRCTRAFEKQVLLACVNSTVWDVRIKEGIDYETVRGIIDRAIAKNVDWPAIKNLKIIGIDEISLRDCRKTLFS